MVEREQNQTPKKRKCSVNLVTHILKVLKDDLVMRQIFLQKLLDNEDSRNDSSSAKLATKLRICVLQDSQGHYDFLQKKNKDNTK